MSHSQLNYAFMLFWSILGEILRKILFLLKKFLPRNETQKVCFSKPVWKGENSEENLDLLFVQSSKTEQILTKLFFFSNWATG